MPCFKTCCSAPEDFTNRISARVSCDPPLKSAIASCVPRPTFDPKIITGVTNNAVTGTAINIQIAMCQSVVNIKTTAPTIEIMLVRKLGSVFATNVFTCDVSFVKREVVSPDFTLSKYGVLKTTNLCQIISRKLRTNCSPATPVKKFPIADTIAPPINSAKTITTIVWSI